MPVAHASPSQAVRLTLPYYAEDSILRRLEKNRHKVRIPQNVSFKVRMFVEMTSYVADGNHAGFDHWAKRNNLKEAAKAFSYLSQHNLLNYEEFQNHISDLEASIHETDEKIQQTQKELTNYFSSISCMLFQILICIFRIHFPITYLFKS